MLAPCKNSKSVGDFELNATAWKAKIKNSVGSQLNAKCEYNKNYRTVDCGEEQ